MDEDKKKRYMKKLGGDVAKKSVDDRVAKATQKTHMNEARSNSRKNGTTVDQELRKASATRRRVLRSSKRKAMKSLAVSAGGVGGSGGGGSSPSLLRRRKDEMK